ncbi:MAG TPA: methyltransferase regulatory domain-containing protein [Pirellulales bacterium]|jgi:SAM-dependent methyltransferase|nr:methyltransferase regulatory domain-containing protein [Pirellulales bacterium]
MASRDISNSYDQTPYPRHAYGFSHPDRLATLATLHGLEPPPLRTARILEVGCARGTNLVPMAYALPEAEFVGIDLSERQIAEAREFAAGVGLKNIRFEQRDLAALDDGIGRFDYIIAHGVYSWVPPAVGQALLELCGRRLTDNGLALVSYNAYPGCHLRQMVRAMGRFHTRAIDEPRQRVEQMHALMQLLVRFSPDDGSAYIRILRSEADRLARLSDELVLHDVLEEANYPVYFHEFVDRCRNCGLQYICEALPVDRRRSGIAADVLAKLAKQYDPIELEQQLDFLEGTSFRRSIICRSGQKRTRDALADASLADETTSSRDPLKRLLLATAAQPLSAAPELSGNRPEEFVARKDRVTASLRCDQPIEKMSLAVLGEVYPRTMPFDELLAAATGRLGRTPTPQDHRELRALVAGGFPIGAIDLHSWQPPAVNTVSRCPEASPVARYELAHGWAATTLWHDRFVVDDLLSRQLVINLDGRTDRGALIDRLTRASAEQQASPLRPASQSPSWLAAGLQDQVASRLDAALSDLARSAVLIA